jgi:hypothetical protein
MAVFIGVIKILLGFYQVRDSEAPPIASIVLENDAYVRDFSKRFHGFSSR